MESFKSDNIDISNNLYANIPTGALIPIAGPISLYSNSAYTQAGLLPCNGTEWSISTYQTLYNLITQNGTVFPFGTNTNGSGGAGSTHFKLPNMLLTKYFLVGTSSNISISNSIGHDHTQSTSFNLTTNAQTWNHYHDYSASSDSVSMNAHNHSYPSLNASSAGNGNLVQNKSDASGPTAASPSHSHGSFNMNAGASNAQNAGTHSHTGNSASTTATDLGGHTHTGISGTTTFNASSVPVYPNFQNVLYFIKS